MFKLRPYQLRAVEYCTKQLAERHNSLLVAATGAGKTIMLAAVAQWICRQAKGKVYVVVGRDKINQQNIEKFRKVVPEYPASEYSGRMKSMHGRVVFLTVQTAINHYMKLDRPLAVIFDETHHARAASYETLLKFWKPTYVFGATATPERGDGKSLGKLFDNAHQISARELIDMNYLSKPEFHDFVAVSDIPRDITPAERESYVQAIKSDLSAAFRKLNRLPGKSIIFCRSHTICAMVVDILRDLGHGVSYIKSGSSENESEMATFLAGKTQWLVNVDIATEGFDDPYITNVFNLCSDGTRGRWVQKVGRGLRPHQNKTICRVFDCGGNIGEYGTLDFTECLPKEVEKSGTTVRVGDIFAESGGARQLEFATAAYSAGETSTPYSAPDGWFSFYDPDYETVFLRNDGCLVRLPDGREIDIAPTVELELDDVVLPATNRIGTNDGVNAWQLGRLTDVPTFGLTQEQANAVLRWKVWKSQNKGV